MESGYYPPGAEFDLNAPYNQESLPKEEIEVTISVTLSKTVKVKVNDYKVEKSGVHTSYDFSGCDLYKAVEEQVVLPQNLSRFTEEIFNHDLNLKAVGMSKYLEEAIEDCKGWYVDEFEVIKD